MLHHLGNEGKPVDPDWHEFRDRARLEAFSPEEFGEIERVRYDLDDDDPRSAEITGEDNPASYKGEHIGVEGHESDIDGRDLPWR